MIFLLLIVFRNRRWIPWLTAAFLLVLLGGVAVSMTVEINPYRDGTSNEATMSTLRNGLATAKAIATDENYSGLNSEILASSEPALPFTTGASTDVKQVSWAVSTTTSPEDTVTVAALSDTGDFFFIRDIATADSGGTYFGKSISGCSARSLTAASASDS